MINLLPPEEKKLLHREQLKKLIVILGSTAIVSLLCLWLVLLAINFYALGEAANVNATLKQAEVKYQTQDFLLYKQRIEDANAVFAKMNQGFSGKASVADVLPFLSRIDRPAGIVLTHVVAQSQPGDILISISGTSDTRENLMAFKKSLETNAAVKQMDFPSNNWLKPADLDFYLTFHYGQP